MIFNVYKWHVRRRSLSRAIRVWQGNAKHAPGAIAAAHVARPQLRGSALFARSVLNDPYAGDPLTLVEEDQS